MKKRELEMDEICMEKVYSPNNDCLSGLLATKVNTAKVANDH